MIYIVDNGRGIFVSEQRHTPEIYAHNELLIKKFIQIKMLDGLSHYSIDNYTTYARLLNKRVGKRFEEIKPVDIRVFLSKYKAENDISNYAMNQIRLNLNTFFIFLEQEEFRDGNPMVKIKPIKYEKKIKEPFSDDEIIKMEDACITIKERAIFDFLNTTACRVSEVVKLNISDIDFENMQCIVNGKGSKQRYVYFNSMAKLHLQEYLKTRDDSNPALFVCEKFPHDRMSRHGYEWIINQIAERAGVENAYPHRFRRSVATRLLDRGMPIEQVQKLLGHSKMDTTLIYASVNNRSVKINHGKFVN